MTRVLSGSLRHLAPPALLRLLAATSPSGVLELLTESGALRLEILDGQVAMVAGDELLRAGRILECSDGDFRFQPRPLKALTGEPVGLSAFAEAALASFASEPGALSDQLASLTAPGAGPRARIHVLPTAPPENPLDELLSELEETAPSELLLAQVGVVAANPRLWRGTLESRWRSRGWQLRLYGTPGSVPFAELDLLLVHHQLSITRVGQEEEWTALVERAREREPSLPVVWIGPLGDPIWVHRLIEAGATYLIPAPQGEGGEAFHRFVDSVSLVVERQLQSAQASRRTELPGGLADLVDTLLWGADAEQAIGALLQLAAAQLLRGAVLVVEETAVRCRAGYGYPLDRGSRLLPRGVGLLERVVRSGDAVVGIDPIAGGAMQLARVLGVDRLPADLAVIPLGRGTASGGLLVGDREGEALPEIDELILLARRFGGMIVGQ